MARQDEEIRFSLVDGVTKGLKAIGDNLGTITEAGAKLNQNFELVGKGIEKIKQAAELFATPVEKAAKLEEALRRVGSVTNASADEFKILEKAVLAAAAQFGVPIDEAAAALENLARNGGTAADAANALAPALALAKAAGIGATEAAAILGDTLDQFSLQASDAGLVADTLARAAIAAGTGVSGLAENFTVVAPAAALAKANITDTAAAIGLLAEAGVEKAAGKALANIFTQLSDSASTLREDLRGAGVDATDFAGLVRILSNDGNLAARVYSDLGPKVGPILARAVQQGSGALADLTKNLAGANGAAAQLAKQATSGLIGAFDRLKVAIDIIEIASGKPLLKPLADNLDLLTSKLIAFSDSPEFVKIEAALTELFDNAGKALRAYIDDFRFDDAKAAFTDFANNAKTYFELVSNYAQAAGDGVIGAFQGIRAAFDAVDTTVSLLVGTLAKIGARLIEPFVGVIDGLDKVQAKLRTLADDAFTRAVAASEGFSKATDAASRKIDDAAEAMKRAEEASAKLAAGTTNAGNAAGTAAPKVDKLAESFHKVTPEVDAATKAAEDNAKANAKAAEENERNAQAAAKTAQESRDYATALNKAEIAANKAAQSYADLQRDASATPEALAKAREEFIRSGNALEKLRNHQQLTATESKDLTDAFRDLGITSEAQLVKKVNLAAAALDKVAAAQKAGTATTHDLQIAFDAYAQAARAAAENAEPAQRTALQNQLAQKAAVLGLTETMKQLGQTGTDANQSIAASGADAAAALEHVASAADEAAGSAEHFADATTRAADASSEAGDQLGIVGSSLVGVSIEFAKAADKLNTLARQPFFIQNFNRLADIFTRQTIELNKQVAALDKQLGQTDELTKRVEKLQRQFRTLGEDQLRALAEKQLQVEAQIKRKQDELDQQRADFEKQQQQAAADAIKAQTGSTQGAGLGPGTPQTITINIHGVLAADKDEFARQIAPAIQRAVKDRAFLSR